MPDGKPEPRLLTEDEAYAISGAEVKRECASRDAEIEKLKAENASLAKERDEALARETAQKSETATAQKALEDFKAEVAAKQEAVERRTTREKALRESAAGMPDTFFSDTARLDRVAAMSDEEFAAYSADLKTALGGKPEGGPPRETAMSTVATAKPGATKKYAIGELLGVSG